LIPHVADNGFPSDHTLYAMVVAATLFVFKRKTGILVGVLAVLIGLARVSAGVHHPVDIIASVVIAIIATLLSYLVLKLLTQIKVLTKLFNLS
jgi:undecaprenyl-diphosphatase